MQYKYKDYYAWREECNARIEEIKAKIHDPLRFSIAELIERDGLQVTGNGKNQSTKEHDSIIIDTETNNFFWNSRGESGDAITWLRNYHGMSYLDALKTLGYEEPEKSFPRNSNWKEHTEKNSDIKPVVFSEPEVKKPQTKELKLPENTKEIQKTIAYLCKARGVDENLVREICKDGLIYQSKNKVVFVGKDGENHIRFASTRSSVASVNRVWNKGIKQNTEKETDEYVMDAYSFQRTVEMMYKSGISYFEASYKNGKGRIESNPEEWNYIDEALTFAEGQQYQDAFIQYLKENRIIRSYALTGDEVSEEALNIMVEAQKEYIKDKPELNMDDLEIDYNLFHKKNAYETYIKNHFSEDVDLTEIKIKGYKCPYQSRDIYESEKGQQFGSYSSIKNKSFIDSNTYDRNKLMQLIDKLEESEAKYSALVTSNYIKVTVENDSLNQVKKQLGSIKSDPAYRIKTKGENVVTNMDVAGSEKEYAFKFGNPEAKIVQVFEAPIDALSKATLDKMRFGKSFMSQFAYLSLSGISTAALEKYIEEHPDTETVQIGTDNDEAGNRAVEDIKKLWQTKGYTNIRLERIPTKNQKDWNEELQSFRRKIENNIERENDERVKSIYENLDFSVKEFADAVGTGSNSEEIKNDAKLYIDYKNEEALKRLEKYLPVAVLSNEEIKKTCSLVRLNESFNNAKDLDKNFRIDIFKADDINEKPHWIRKLNFHTGNEETLESVLNRDREYGEYFQKSQTFERAILDHMEYKKEILEDLMCSLEIYEPHNMNLDEIVFNVSEKAKNKLDNYIGNNYQVVGDMVRCSGSDKKTVDILSRQERDEKTGTVPVVVNSGFQIRFEKDPKYPVSLISDNKKIKFENLKEAYSFLEEKKVAPSEVLLEKSQKLLDEQNKKDFGFEEILLNGEAVASANDLRKMNEVSKQGNRNRKSFGDILYYNYIDADRAKILFSEMRKEGIVPFIAFKNAKVNFGIQDSDYQKMQSIIEKRGRIFVDTKRATNLVRTDIKKQTDKLVSDPKQLNDFLNTLSCFGEKYGASNSILIYSQDPEARSVSKEQTDKAIQIIHNVNKKIRSEVNIEQIRKSIAEKGEANLDRFIITKDNENYNIIRKTIRSGQEKIMKLSENELINYISNDIEMKKYDLDEIQHNQMNAQFGTEHKNDWIENIYLSSKKRNPEFSVNYILEAIYRTSSAVFSIKTADMEANLKNTIKQLIQNHLNLVNKKNPMTEASFKFREACMISLLERKLGRKSELNEKKIMTNIPENVFEDIVYINRNTNSIFRQIESEYCLLKSKDIETLNKESNYLNAFVKEVPSVEKLGFDAQSICIEELQKQLDNKLKVEVLISDDSSVPKGRYSLAEYQNLCRNTEAKTLFNIINKDEVLVQGQKIHDSKENIMNYIRRTVDDGRIVSRINRELLESIALFRAIKKDEALKPSESKKTDNVFSVSADGKTAYTLTNSGVVTVEQNKDGSVKDPLEIINKNQIRNSEIIALSMNKLQSYSKYETTKKQIINSKGKGNIDAFTLLSAKGVQIEQLSEETFSRITDEIGKYRINNKADELEKLKLNYNVSKAVDDILKTQYIGKFVTAKKMLSEIYESMFSDELKKTENADSVIEYYKKEFFKLIEKNDTEFTDIIKLKNTVENKLNAPVNFNYQLPQDKEMSVPAETIGL